MKVWPKNETMRKVLKHADGTAFREKGPAEWPNDSFTARRVKEGSVLLTEPKLESPKVGRVNKEN